MNPSTEQLKSTAIVVYEVEQLPALQRYLKDNATDCVVYSLDAEVDVLLRDTGISFRSGRELRPNIAEHLVSIERVTAGLAVAYDWLRYCDVPLIQVFAPSVQGYALQASYYADIFDTLLKQEHLALVVLESAQALPQAGAIIVGKQLSVVVDVAGLVARQHGIHFQSVPSVIRAPHVGRRAKLDAKRAALDVALGTLNRCIRLLRGRGAIRVLASDYWRNVAPVFKHLPGAQVTMYDRKEILNARFKNIWRYRMQFVHADSFSSRRDEARRADAVKKLQQQWTANRDAFFVNQPAIQPLMLELYDDIGVIWLAEAARQVDETYAMIDALKPHVVLLRATVSQQWHFPLLALVAKARGIPSLELLHGMEYPGPGSIDRWHVAEYLGVYGAYVQSQMERVGFTKAQLPVLGSPRFDSYRREVAGQLSSVHDSITIFCTVPDMYSGITMDTYDVESYLEQVAQAVRAIPNASVILKLRPGPRREAFYRRAIAEAFKGIPHTIAQYERLVGLFADSDIAVSCQTTVTLEALQSNVPLVAFAATPLECMMLEFNFGNIASVGAARVCTSIESLKQALQSLATPSARDAQKAAAKSLLDSQFAFDGQGAKRTAEFIQDVTRRAGKVF